MSAAVFHLAEAFILRIRRIYVLTLLVCISLNFGGVAGIFASNVADHPSAELQRLSWMIGTWDTETLYRFTPDAPPFEGRSVETVRWSPNQQFVISDQRGLMPDGWRNKLVIISWNPGKSEYNLVDVTSTGETVQMAMQIEDGVRKVLYYRPFDGRLIRTELTFKSVSDVESRFRCDCTDGERTWTFCEGISKKRKTEKTD